MTKTMQTLRFRTNINCAGCVAAVQSRLDRTAGVGRWQVDTAARDKILTVQSADVTTEAIMATIQEAGFVIENLNA